MIKKILAILLLVSVVQIPAYVSAADETTEEHKVDVLTSLDILAGNYAGTYKPTGKVTYHEFLTAVSGFMTELKPADVLGFSRAHGLLRDGDVINLKNEITYGEAVRILVRAGGYSEAIPGNAEDAAYRKVAEDRDLTDGVGLQSGDKLTNSAMISVLYNCIDASITDYKYDGNTYKANEIDDETILSRYRNIYETEGVVTDNGYTGLRGESEAGENSVIIGDFIMEKGSNYDADYLGYNVRAFFINDDDNYTFKYAYPTENTEAEFLSEDIVSISDDLSVVQYDKENKTDKMRIDTAVKVIYNGKVYFDYTADDFTKANTSVKLIDNNKDKKADVAHITAYETVYVSYITSYESKIINRYSYDGAMSNIDIEDDSKDFTVNFIYDGKKVENPVINGRNVLSIATSYGDNPIRNIYISDRTVTGTLDRISSTGEYILDGEAFRSLPEFDKARALNDAEVPEMEIGKDYTFYLDFNGKIAGIAKSESAELSYAVMLKMMLDEDDEQTVTARYMDSKGEWNTAKLAKTVKLYNDEYIGKRLKSYEVFKICVGEAKKITPQLVQMATDIDGNINILKTAVATDEYDKDRMTVHSKISDGCYRWTTKMFGSANGPLVYASNDYVVFTFPSGVSYDEEDYSIGNLFEADKIYNIVPYNVDRFQTSNCFIVEGSAAGTVQENLFLVTGTAEAISSDGDVKKTLIGRFGNYEEISVFAKDDSIFNGVKAGDVLEISLDGRGRVVAKNFVYSTSQGYQTSMSISYSGRAAGYVKDIDNETKSILIDVGTKEIVVKHAGNAPQAKNLKVYLNDKENDGIEAVNFSDILIGDFIVTKLEFADVSDVIIIRNY